MKALSRILRVTLTNREQPKCLCCGSADVTLEKNDISRWVQCHYSRCGMTHFVSMHPELEQFFRPAVEIHLDDPRVERRLFEGYKAHGHTVQALRKVLIVGYDCALGRALGAL